MKLFRKNLMVVTALAALLMGVSSVAGSAAHAAQGDEIVAGIGGQILNLTVDEGQVIRLPGSATSVFVSNPDVADVQVKSGQLLYVMGRRPGHTSFYAVDQADNVLISRQIVVGLNLAALRTAIRQITGADTVKVSQVEDMIMLKGSVDNTTIAQDVVRMSTRYLPRAVLEAGSGDMDNLARNYIINQLGISGSNQVNIRVRLAEVSRNGVKTLGIGTSVANPNLFGNVDMSFGFDAGVSLSGAAGTGGLSSTIGATTLTAALDALVEDGLANVLAEPNLTALSGETATFLAGGEFPIPVASSDGDVTVEFREYGVRLSFTPTVVSGSRINLRVRPEVSDRDDARAVSFAGGEIPGLVTRRAETSVELGSGQSFAIAGLLRNDTSQSIDKYPGLGDIPILGALFRSDRFQQNQSELVIVVTPYLVKPVSTQPMLPTDGFVAPNDVDRWLNGRVNSAAPTPTPVPVARMSGSTAEAGLVGNVGYELK